MHKTARIVWSRELQFAALEEGWAIVRYGSTNQTATLVNYIDYRNRQIAKFATSDDALMFVQARSIDRDGGLHRTALAFLKQQTTNQEKGSWEPSCGKDGVALERFYHRMAKERRDARRVGNRVPEHQRAMMPPPLIKFTVWDEHDAAKEGWVLDHRPMDSRVVPRTCDKAIHLTDEDAEKFVEAQAERDRFRNKVDTLHIRAIEFRDRWRKDGQAAARYAHWGKDARKKAQGYIRGWYAWNAGAPVADEAKGERVVTNDEGGRIVLTAEQLRPLPPPFVKR